MNILDDCSCRIRLPLLVFRFEWHQFILPPAKSHFLTMFELHSPIDFRIDAAEFIRAWVMAVLHGSTRQATGLVDKVRAPWPLHSILGGIYIADDLNAALH